MAFFPLQRIGFGWGLAALLAAFTPVPVSAEEDDDRKHDRYEDHRDWHRDRYEDHRDWRRERYEGHRDWHRDRYEDHRDWHRDREVYRGPVRVYGPPPRWTRGHRIHDYGWAPTVIVIDYHRYGLRHPPHGHHWRRDERGDWLLVAIATGIIADVVLSR